LVFHSSDAVIICRRDQGTRHLLLELAVVDVALRQREERAHLAALLQLERVLEHEAVRRARAGQRVARPGEGRGLGAGRGAQRDAQRVELGRRLGALGAERRAREDFQRARGAVEAERAGGAARRGRDLDAVESHLRLDLGGADAVPHRADGHLERRAAGDGEAGDRLGAGREDRRRAVLRVGVARVRQVLSCADHKRRRERAAAAAEAQLRPRRALGRGDEAARLAARRLGARRRAGVQLQQPRDSRRRDARARRRRLGPRDRHRQPEERPAPLRVGVKALDLGVCDLPLWHAARVDVDLERAPAAGQSEDRRRGHPGRGRAQDEVQVDGEALGAHVGALAQARRHLDGEGCRRGGVGGLAEVDAARGGRAGAAARAAHGDVEAQLGRRVDARGAGAGEVVVRIQHLEEATPVGERAGRAAAERPRGVLGRAAHACRRGRAALGLERGHQEREAARGAGGGHRGAVHELPRGGRPLWDRGDGAAGRCGVGGWAVGAGGVSDSGVSESGSERVEIERCAL
jgi:hypothetical protein